MCVAFIGRVDGRMMYFTYIGQYEGPKIQTWSGSGPKKVRIVLESSLFDPYNCLESEIPYIAYSAD